MGDFVEEMVASVGAAREKYWVFLQKLRQTIRSLKYSSVLNYQQPAANFKDIVVFLRINV